MFILMVWLQTSHQTCFNSSLCLHESKFSLFKTKSWYYICSFLKIYCWTQDISHFTDTSIISVSVLPSLNIFNKLLQTAWRKHVAALHNHWLEVACVFLLFWYFPWVVFMYSSSHSLAEEIFYLWDLPDKIKDLKKTPNHIFLPKFTKWTSSCMKKTWN